MSWVWGVCLLAISIIHYVYICLYMENKFGAYNDGENTLPREWIGRSAAILRQPEQLKYKTGYRMEKTN